MKKNWLYCTLVAIPLMSGLTACNNEDDPNPNPNPEPTTTYGAYIVNTGSGNNYGSIQWFDKANQTITGDLYKAQNGKDLGDLQDLCIYGSKMYAVSTQSSKVEVLDLNGKLLKSIPMNTAEEKPMNPRYAVGAEGFVFITAYDGTVSRLDTLSQEITGSVEVEAYPEALTYVDGKLYVNISGYGSGDKVAVVDVKSWTKTPDITVKLNPYTVIFDGIILQPVHVFIGNYQSRIAYALNKIERRIRILFRPIGIFERTFHLPYFQIRSIPCRRNSIVYFHQIIIRIYLCNVSKRTTQTFFIIIQR